MKKRDINLDIIKLISTFIVIMHHYQQTTHLYFNHGINFYGGRVYFGAVVELFFIISGYFAYSFISKIREGLSFKEYFLKKYLRFFPLMVMSVAVYEVFAIVFNKTYGQDLFDLPISLLNCVLSATGIKALLSDSLGINNPIWYIGVLMWCFIILYITTKLSKNDKWLYSIFVGIILFGVITAILKCNIPFINYHCSRGYYSFFLGVILKGLLDKRNNYFLVRFLALFVFMGALAWLVLFNKWPSFIVAFILGPALVVVTSKLSIKNIKFNKIISDISSIGFNMYVWHMPILIMILSLNGYFKLNYRMESVNVWILYLFACLCWGTASHYLFEKPFNSIVLRRIK